MSITILREIKEKITNMRKEVREMKEKMNNLENKWSTTEKRLKERLDQMDEKLVEIE